MLGSDLTVQLLHDMLSAESETSADLRNSLQVAKALIVSQAGQVDTLRSHLAAEVERSQKLATALARAEQGQEVFRKEVISLTKTVNDATEMVKALNAANQKAAQAVKGAEMERDGALAHARNVEYRAEQARDALSRQYEKEIKNLHGQIDGITAQYEKECIALKRQLEEVQGRMILPVFAQDAQGRTYFNGVPLPGPDWEKENQALVMKLAEVKRYNEILQDDLRNARAELEDSRKGLMGELEETRRRARTSNDHLISMIIKANATITNLRGQNSHLVQRVSELNAALDSAHGTPNAVELLRQCDAAQEHSRLVSEAHKIMQENVTRTLAGRDEALRMLREMYNKLVTESTMQGRFITELEAKIKVQDKTISDYAQGMNLLHKPKFGEMTINAPAGLIDYLAQHRLEFGNRFNMKPLSQETGFVGIRFETDSDDDDPGCGFGDDEDECDCSDPQECDCCPHDREEDD